MKKIIFIILLFNIFIKIYAIEDIEIDGEKLSPIFDKDIYKYNFYTNEDEINIKIKENNTIKNNKYFLNELDNTIKIDKYEIHVFKNYNNMKEESYIKELTIDNYDLNFNKDIYEYKININDEDHLIINYELSNYDDILTISGNGNFNKTDNVILVSLNDKTYIIHAYKTIVVSKVDNNSTIEYMSESKKEIVKVIISTISSIIVIIFYYIIFIDKTTISI